MQSILGFLKRCYRHCIYRSARFHLFYTMIIVFLWLLFWYTYFFAPLQHKHHELESSLKELKKRAGLLNTLKKDSGSLEQQIENRLSKPHERCQATALLQEIEQSLLTAAHNSNLTIVSFSHTAPSCEQQYAHQTSSYTLHSATTASLISFLSHFTIHKTANIAYTHIHCSVGEGSNNYTVKLDLTITIPITEDAVPKKQTLQLRTS